MQVCDRCGGPYLSRTVDKYTYKESGLDNVVLLNVEERVCPKCDEPMVVIPRVTELHGAIGIALVHKPSLLTGKEIGFIRKLLGFSEPEFALRLYSSPQDVLYWEQKDEASWAATDRLIRALLILKAKFQGFWPDIGYEQVDLMLAEVTAHRTPQCQLEVEFYNQTWIVRTRGETTR